ncbi:MAG: DUF4153 domain-containing protein [Pseudomonadota bacterium]
MWKSNNIFGNKQVFILRLLVGLVFGLALAWLIESTPNDHGDSNSTEIWRQVCFAVIGLGAFVLWAGLGAMRRISLAIWAVTAAIVIAYVANHSVTMGDARGVGYLGETITFLIFPFLFIAHELVSSGDQAGKIIAPYETYFDEAWKRGVQLILSLIFTQLFLGILFLGGALLGFIGIDWLKNLLDEKYFMVPAMGMAMASAVHLSDVQPKLLSNFRNLILSIFAWLLPLIVLVGGIFVVSLAFTGLAPLWSTKAATATLLAGCVIFVLLINAAYGQGEETHKINTILKFAIRIATLILAIFSVLAAYSLALRINQYGFTPDRVFALIGVVIAVSYGAAYLAANIGRGAFMVNIEQANIGLAFVKAAVFLAVLTPFANPSRLSVDSQVARLESGKITVDKFDWRLLRFETGKYGSNALRRLTASNVVAIKSKAIETQALNDDDRHNRPPQTEPAKLQKPDIAQFTIVKGGALPQSFLNQEFDINDVNLPICLRERTKSAHCEIAIIDLNGDNASELVFKADYQLFLYYQENGLWKIQDISGFPFNENFKRAFTKGDISAAEPKWDDLIIGNQVIDIPSH